jgi:hypothetical protein
LKRDGHENLQRHQTGPNCGSAKEDGPAPEDVLGLHVDLAPLFRSQRLRWHVSAGIWEVFIGSVHVDALQFSFSQLATTDSTQQYHTANPKNSTPQPTAA